MLKWMLFDENSWCFLGILGKGDWLINFIIFFSDFFVDMFDIFVMVNVVIGFFKLIFDDIEVELGEEIEFDLEFYIWNLDDVEIDVMILLN